MTTYQTKRVTFETKIDSLIPAGDGPFKIVAFELTHDGEGWSVNTPFCIGNNLDREETISRLKSRFNVFKANYNSKARIMDIEDSSMFPDVCNLEIDQTAFADVIPVNPI